MIVDGWGAQVEAAATRLGLWMVIGLGFATSLDALAVGVGMGLSGSPIVLPAAIIGLVTAGLVALGAALGHLVPTRAPEIVGGMVLIALAIRIVIQHTLAGI